MADDTSSLALPSLQNTFSILVKQVSRIGSTVIIILSLLVLVGWATDIPILKSLLPWFTPMNPLETLLFVFLVVALLIRTDEATDLRKRDITTGILCLPVFLVGVITLYGYATGMNPGWDQIFFHAKLDGSRIALNTGLNFILLSIAIVSLKKNQRTLFRLSQKVTLITGIITMFAMVGYLYNILTFYTVGSSIPMPLNTALAFTLLCVSILFSTPNHGIIKIVTEQSRVNRLARGFLLLAILIPLLSGFIVLVGQKAGIFTYPTGIALTSVIHILIFTSLVWWNTRFVTVDETEKNRMTVELRQQKKELEKSQLQLHDKIEQLEKANKTIKDILNYQDRLKDIIS